MSDSLSGLELEVEMPLHRDSSNDAAEILDEGGAVCDSVGWQVKCILLHKPTSSGKQSF